MLTRVLACVLGSLAGGLVGGLLASATGFRPLFHIGLIGGGALAVVWAERGPGRVSSNAEDARFEGDDWEDRPARSRPGSDRLDGRWTVLIWATVLIPFAGPWIAVLVSSAAYYGWRADYPRKAAAANLHGWLAWLAGNALWLGLLAVASRFLVWQD